MIKQITDDMVGKSVTCRIYSEEVQDAKIQKKDHAYYICQNLKDGTSCGDKLGYKHSWWVNGGSERELASNSIYDLKLVSESKELPIFN